MAYGLPSDEGLMLDPPSFRITLARRLRLVIQPEDGPCSRCGGVMDRYGDHASVCTCAGDRARRHNGIRYRVCDAAKEGGLGPEKEKAGLLPSSMDHGDARGPRNGGPRESRGGHHRV